MLLDIYDKNSILNYEHDNSIRLIINDNIYLGAAYYYPVLFG